MPAAASATDASVDVGIRSLRCRFGIDGTRKVEGQGVGAVPCKNLIPIKESETCDIQICEGKKQGVRIV